MDNNKKKPEEIIDSLKGGSVFSFLKAPDNLTGGVPPPKPQPLTRPEPDRRSQDDTGLKNRLAELEAKIKSIEAEASKPTTAPAQEQTLDLFRVMEKRLAGLESRLAAVQERTEPAPDYEEKVRAMLIRAEGEIRGFLEEYRRSGEEKAAEMAELIAELGRKAGSDRLAISDGAAGLAGVRKALEAAGERSMALERSLEEGKIAVKALLMEERRLREEAAANVAGQFEKVGLETADGRQESGEALGELNGRLEEYRAALDETRNKAEAARKHGEELERALRETHEEVKDFLAVERRQREKAAVETAGWLDKIEQEIAAIKASMAKIPLEIAAIKDDVLGAANKVLAEAHERLEVLTGKMQGDILNAAAAKFSALQSIWKTAEVKIQAAQKTAYWAQEECEKLDTSLRLLEHKTNALDRKYSSYTAEPSKPGGGGQ